MARLQTGRPELAKQQGQISKVYVPSPSVSIRPGSILSTIGKAFLRSGRSHDERLKELSKEHSRLHKLRETRLEEPSKEIHDLIRKSELRNQRLLDVLNKQERFIHPRRVLREITKDAGDVSSKSTMPGLKIQDVIQFLFQQKIIKPSNEEK